MYYVAFSPETEAYLDAQLGWEARVLTERLVEMLGVCPDDYRESQRLPALPGKPAYFGFRYFFPSRQGLLAFDFTVSESGLAAGVLQVVYVEKAG